MVNLYNLEYELLNKSKITDRAPKSLHDVPAGSEAIKSAYKYSKKDDKITE